MPVIRGFCVKVRSGLKEIRDSGQKKSSCFKWESILLLSWGCEKDMLLLEILKQHRGKPSERSEIFTAPHSALTVTTEVFDITLNDTLLLCWVFR